MLKESRVCGYQCAGIAQLSKNYSLTEQSARGGHRPKVSQDASLILGAPACSTPGVM